MRFPTILIEIGTRVRSINNICVPNNLTGTVVYSEVAPRGRKPQLLYVNWDKEMPGFHGCYGKANPGHGWNVRMDTVKIIGYNEWKKVEDG